jgi:hypothetical protein
MEIHISDWTHKFQNKTGLDAKANLELYKSSQVNSAYQAVPILTLNSQRYLYLKIDPRIGESGSRQDCL